MNKKTNKKNIKPVPNNQKIRSCVIVETPLDAAQQQEITNFFEHLLQVSKIEFYERRKKICKL